MNKALLGCSHTFSLTHCPGLFTHCSGGAEWVWQTLHTWQSLSYLPCGSLLEKKKKVWWPLLRAVFILGVCMGSHVTDTLSWRLSMGLSKETSGTRSEISWDIWAEFWPRHGCEGGVRERAGGVFPGRVRRVVQEGWRVLVTEEAGDVNEDGLSGWKGRTSGGLGVSRQWAALVWGRVRENTEGYSLVIYI